jgi:hypothetical protein
MTRNNDDNNLEIWQKLHIEEVLKHHNGTYGTRFDELVRCEESFPGIAASTRWDWVCRDLSTDRKAAIEVKRITDRRKHEQYSVLEEIRDIVQGESSRRLRGTYRLVLYYDGKPLDFGKGKEEISKAIIDAVERWASCMTVGAPLDFTGELRKCVPGIIPLDCRSELTKVGDEGQFLCMEIYTGGSAPSGPLTGHAFGEFKILLKKANRQLGEANNRGISETFLVFLDLLYYLVPSPESLRESLSQLGSADHCNIKYIYLKDSSVTRIKP